MNSPIDDATAAVVHYIIQHLHGLPADKFFIEIFFTDVLTAFAAVCCEEERKAIEQERWEFLEPSLN